MLTQTNSEAGFCDFYFIYLFFVENSNSFPLHVYIEYKHTQSVDNAYQHWPQNLQVEQYFIFYRPVSI